MAGFYAFIIGKRARWRWTWRAGVGAMLLLVAVAVPFARGQDSPTPDQPQDTTNSKPPDDQRWNLNYQSTVIGQWAAPFPAKYSGGNSLEPHREVKDTFSFDVTAGIRLWRGGEFFADVLTWQGYGLSKTTGLAGFPNGEAYRLGKTYPDVIVARGYLRETLPLGGGRGPGADPKALSEGSGGQRRLILSIGHIPVTEDFDKNAYANDPRTQFMNWAFVNNAAWDYPANSLGFSNGVSMQFDLGSWTARAGLFQDSQFANALRMDWNLLHAWSLAGELEKRHSFQGHPGAARLFSYETKAHMGNYQESLSDPQNIYANGQRGYRSKYGFGINLEQEVQKDLGAFVRLGWSDGKNQTWEFTDVDRTATAGLSLKGTRWRRAEDTVGVGVDVNGISAVHREFLAAGGLGITVGDGALNYRSERVGETYYNWNVAKHFQLTLDYQFAQNPAYNHARGPVNIFALRLHTEY